MGHLFRVWYIPQVPMKPFRFEVPDIATARIVKEALIKFSLFEFENNVKPDYADAIGIEKFSVKAQEWWEYHEEDEDEDEDEEAA